MKSWKNCQKFIKFVEYVVKVLKIAKNIRNSMKTVEMFINTSISLKNVAIDYQKFLKNRWKCCKISEKCVKNVWNYVKIIEKFYKLWIFSNISTILLIPFFLTLIKFSHFSGILNPFLSHLKHFLWRFTQF